MLENISPMNLIDGYKTSHREQYPVGTTLVYSNFTPRQSRVKGINNVVMYGLQYFIKEYLIERFNKHFFDLPKQDVLDSYKKRLDNYLGTDYDISHIGELHDLGYLPIKINALPEGTLIPLNVPCLLLENTDERFFWLTNYLETLLSNILWKPMTSATIANKYKNTFIDYAIKTGYGLSCPDAIKWQGHDFSFRGMSGIEDALMSASGHLLSFTGTDCVPAIDFIEMYYNTDSTKELIGGSIPASEHSTMSAAGDTNEFELYKRLVTEVYPNGLVSIVSDTWDFWSVLDNILPKLKEEILNREGRVVIRPDSGDPVEIICGKIIKDFTNDQYLDVDLDSDDILSQIKESDCIQEYYMEELRENTDHGKYGGDVEDVIFKLKDKYYKMYIRVDWNRYDKQYYFIECSKITKLEEYTPTSEELGAYETLWNTFGGTINEKGYKDLNTKIGLIYGDSITMDRQTEILSRLMDKGFSASNLVLGIGSFTYEYVTRDTFGFAMKATYVEVNGEPRNIFKKPKTDKDNFKKSATGLLNVYMENDVLKLEEQCNLDTMKQSAMETVFLNGKITKEYTFKEIREKLISENIRLKSIESN